MITVYVDNKATLKLIEMKDLFEGKSGKNIQIEFIDAAPLTAQITYEGQNAEIAIYVRNEMHTNSVLNNHGIVKNGKIEVDDGDEETAQIAFGVSQGVNAYLLNNNLVQVCEEMDEDFEGLLFVVDNNGVLKSKIVKGKNRPNLLCTTLFGGHSMMRPYADEIMGQFEMEMLSFEEQEEAAMQGNADAMEQVAMAYLNGDEVDADAEKSLYWFEKCAEVGNSQAMFNVGLFYAKGYGTKRDLKKAAEWMSKAANEGDDDAADCKVQYCKMANLYDKALSGDAQAQADYAEALVKIGGVLEQAGSDTDYAESVVWAERAMQQGNGKGYWILALAYQHGRGVEADLDKAIELYQMGVNLGDVSCIYNMGCKYLTGEGVVQDKHKGFEMIKNAAEHGNGYAMRELGRCYQFANGTIGNMSTAVEWYEKALEIIKDPELEQKVQTFKMMGEMDPSFAEDYPETQDDIDLMNSSDGYIENTESIGNSYVYCKEVDNSVRELEKQKKIKEEQEKADKKALKIATDIKSKMQDIQSTYTKNAQHHKRMLALHTFDGLWDPELKKYLSKFDDDIQKMGSSTEKLLKDAINSYNEVSDTASPKNLISIITEIEKAITYVNETSISNNEYNIVFSYTWSINIPEISKEFKRIKEELKKRQAELDKEERKRDKEKKLVLLKKDLDNELHNSANLEAWDDNIYVCEMFDKNIYIKWLNLIDAYNAQHEKTRSVAEEYFKLKYSLHKENANFVASDYEREMEEVLNKQLQPCQKVAEKIYAIFKKQHEFECDVHILVEMYDEINIFIDKYLSLCMQSLTGKNIKVQSADMEKIRAGMKVFEDVKKVFSAEQTKKLEQYTHELTHIQNEIALIESEIERFNNQLEILNKETEKKKESVSNKAKEYDKQLYPLKKSLDDLKKEISLEESSIHSLALEAQKAVFGEKKKKEAVREKNQQLQIMKDKYDKMYADYSRINELKGLVIREQVSIEEAAKLQKNMFVQCIEQCKLYLDKLRNIEALLVWCKENHCC